jgi:hypothetical protein
MFLSAKMLPHPFELYIRTQGVAQVTSTCKFQFFIGTNKYFIQLATHGIKIAPDIFVNSRPISYLYLNSTHHSPI